MPKKGYKMSDETKKKISDSNKMTRLKKLNNINPDYFKDKTFDSYSQVRLEFEYEFMVETIKLLREIRDSLKIRRGI